MDPDSLRNRGERLSEIGDRVGQTYASLRDCVAQSEGSWGDDDIGLAFAKGFEPHADQLLANVRAMAESLHGTAAGIIDAARQYEAQDADLADRLGATAANIGEPAAQRADGRVGTPALADAHSPGTYDPAATSSAAGGQAYPTDRVPPTERSAPSGRRSPEASSGQSTPQDGARRPDSSDRTAPGSDRAGREGSGKPGEPAGASGRRVAPPSSWSLPPAATRNAARSPAAASGPWPAADVRQRDTPWTGQRPPTPGSPTGAQPSSPSSPSSPSPRYGSPPRSTKPTDEPRRGPDRRGSEGRPVSDPVVGWLARRLADHHGVRVVGFDTPGLQVSAVREFVAAVDRVLTDYPVIVLDVVAVAGLGAESGMVRWSSEPRGPTGAARSITLDQRTAQEPRNVTGTEPDIYAATLREFGPALDGAGGGLARRRAQRVLVAEYLRLEPGRHRTLAEVVRGYQHWRAELTGDITAAGGFDVSRAFGVAFAEVVLRGNEASSQAKTLHAVLVDAAARPG